MNTIVIILGLIAVTLGTAGATLLKKAAHTFSFKTFWGFINPYLIFAGTLYVSSTIPFLYALQYTDVSFMYPFTSLHYFLASLAGIIFFNEKLTRNKILGVLFIVIGIILVGIGK